MKPTHPHYRGPRHNRALNAAQEREVCTLRRSGVTQRQICVEYKISRQTILNILRRNAR